MIGLGLIIAPNLGKKFSVSEWKKARADKDYASLKDMTNDLGKQVANKNRQDVITMLGQPDTIGSSVGRRYFYYNVNEPGSSAGRLVVETKNSTVVRTYIHPSELDRLLYKLLPGIY
jgi:hypothetical protein